MKEWRRKPRGGEEAEQGCDCRLDPTLRGALEHKELGLPLHTHQSLLTATLGS